MSTPYRDDHDALMARLVSLIDELDALRTRTRDLRDLERAAGDLEREIAGMRRELARVAPTRLPLLDRVAIASPCSADWAAMTGDERARFCQQCEKHFYNISAMSAEEAEGFLRGTAGEACLRIYRRADGTVLTADCPVGARRKRHRRAVASFVGGGLMTAGALLAAARAQPHAPAYVDGSLIPTVGVAPMSTAPLPPVTPSVMPTVDVPRVTAGVPSRVRSEDRIEAQLAQVRTLLEQRARTKDPAARRDLEAKIKEARATIGKISKDL